MPRLKVYLEEGQPEGLPVAAWALDLPGAYAGGKTRDEALQALLDEVRGYLAWLRKFGEGVPEGAEPIELEVVEGFPAFKSAPDYEVNAFFGPDAQPLGEGEIPRLLHLLEMSRRELLEVLSGAPADAFEWRRDERTRTISEILRHIAGAELWYLSRLPATDPRVMLEQTRSIAQDILGRLEILQRTQFVSLSGEKWSARKVFRRFLYHERYHTKSIRRILEAYRGADSTRKSDGGPA